MTVLDVRAQRLPAPLGARLGGGTLGALVKLAGAVLGAVAMVVVARTLGPHQFGVFAFATTLVGLLGVLADFGGSVVSVRRMAAEPESLARHQRTLVAFRAVTTVPLAVLGWLVVTLSFHGTDRRLALAVLCSFLLCPLLGFVATPLARVQVVRAQLPVLVQSLAWTGAALVLALLGAGGATYALAFTAAAALQVVATVVVAGARVRPSTVTAPLAAITDLARRSAWIGTATLLFVAYQRGGALILQWSGGSNQVARFAVAARASDTLVMMITAVFVGLLPTLSAARYRGDRAGFADQLHAAVRSVLLVVLPVALLVALTARWTVPVLLGSRYAGTAPVVAAAMLGVVGFALELVWNSAALARGVERPQVLASLVTVLLLCAAGPAVAASHGATGVALLLGLLQAARAAFFGTLVHLTGGASPARGGRAQA
jgi:O-antigen/teichoic acid export membrane protein